MPVGGKASMQLSPSSLFLNLDDHNGAVKTSDALILQGNGSMGMDIDQGVHGIDQKLQIEMQFGELAICHENIMQGPLKRYLRNSRQEGHGHSKQESNGKRT